MEFVKGEFVLYRPEDVIFLDSDETLGKYNEFNVGIVIGKIRNYNKDIKVVNVFPITEIDIDDYMKMFPSSLKELFDGTAWERKSRFVPIDKLVKLNYVNEQILDDFSDIQKRMYDEIDDVRRKYKDEYYDFKQKVMDTVSKISCYPSSQLQMSLAYNADKA